MLAETTAGETRQQVLAALGAEDMEQLRSWADSLWHAARRGRDAAGPCGAE